MVLDLFTACCISFLYLLMSLKGKLGCFKHALISWYNLALGKKFFITNFPSARFPLLGLKLKLSCFPKVKDFCLGFLFILIKGRAFLSDPKLFPIPQAEISACLVFLRSKLSLNCCSLKIHSGPFLSIPKLLKLWLWVN